MLVYISRLHRVRSLDSTEDETGWTESTSLSGHAKLKESGGVGTQREAEREAERENEHLIARRNRAKTINCKMEGRVKRR